MRWKNYAILSGHWPSVDERERATGWAIEGDRDDYAARLRRRYPFLPNRWHVTTRAPTAATANCCWQCGGDKRPRGGFRS